MPFKGSKRKHEAASKAVEAIVDTPDNTRAFDKLPFEVMEQILSDLPMKEILLDQRVSKHWKATVEWSRPLQRKLFFLPGLNEAQWYDTKNEDHNGRNVLGYAVKLNLLVVNGRTAGLWDLWDYDFDSFLGGMTSADDKANHRIQIDWSVSRPEWSCYKMRLVSEPVKSIRVAVARGGRRKSKGTGSKATFVLFQQFVVEVGEDCSVGSMYKKLEGKLWDNVVEVKLVAMEPVFTAEEDLKRIPTEHNARRQIRDTSKGEKL